MLRLAFLFCVAASLPATAMPSAAEIGAHVAAMMARTHAKGLAVATIQNGKVHSVAAHGVRNVAGDPLTPDTVMYGASLTKTVFTYGVMILAGDGRLDLDRPIAALLPRPLPDYPGYESLAGDPRWKSITPRMVLTHSTGLPNFAFVEPDHRLHIHFDPGTRYAYSGEGFLLLQLALEKGRGLDVRAFTDRYLKALGITRTSLQWRDDFANSLADGFNDKGQSVSHDKRSHVRTPGSMDTTISDMAKFAAALVSGKGLTPKALDDIERPGLAITTAHQFPTFSPELPPDARRPDLRAGLGVVTFRGPQGPGFYKGGHDEQTANTLVCLVRTRDCVVILSNDVRAEAGYRELVGMVLGETGVPFDWEYGDGAGKSNP
ncbi:MAG: serine hydrolase [Alphaproteobacteria bacterium 64-11]|nr:beta-lactamase family protein [Alphaproteobacteria bacterium]OJU13636.1 MAG: serine hydrolase [Alphaproteobacteria bacterium 64-11]